MTRQTSILITGLAALGLLVSLFLPWVWFADVHTAPQQIAVWLKNPAVQVVFERYPDLPHLMGINLPDTTDTEVTIDQFFTDPVAYRLAVLTHQHQHLSAWFIWFAVPQVGIMLRLGLLLTAILAISGMGCAFKEKFNPRILLPDRIWWGCSAGAVLNFLILVSQVPTLDTFGIQNDLRIVLVCMMSNARAGMSIWLALICLLVMSVSSVITPFLPTTFTTFPDDDEVF